MTVSQDKLNKIRKLMAKAEGTTNAHEAAVFMAKAQEMMQAEGVDMDAVNLSQIGEAKIKSRRSVSVVNIAENTLMHAIGAAFGCQIFWIKSRSSVDTIFGKMRVKDSYARFVLIGSKDRLGLATYAAEVLIKQLDKARTEFANKRSRHYWDVVIEQANTRAEEMVLRGDKAIRNAIRKQVSNDADSFAAGWAHEIQRKVAKFALGDKELLLLATYTKNITGQADTKDLDLNSQFYKGVAAAKDASLHRPIEGGGSEPILPTTKMIEG